jgi:inosose dehydratase
VSRARIRIAGAPITWGVCEVPGWGHQMAPKRVLAEMAELGITATEAGPDGFLPDDPAGLAHRLQEHGLKLVGAFIPVVLHDAARWPGEREEAARRIRLIAAAGGEVAVLAAATGTEGYERSADLDDEQWAHLAKAVAELGATADSEGVLLTMHPHYGTVIETAEQVDRFLRESDAALCLDTGHLMVGGADPVAVAKAAGTRVRHVHLKDVDSDVARRVRRGELGYHEAVGQGLYRPLGRGDLDIRALFEVLDANGFSGWVVLEQDTVLSEEPHENEGPYEAAEASLRYLEGVIGTTADHQSWERGGTHAK